MNNDEVFEFKLWLRSNDNRLRGYAPDEVARLALVCGFSKNVVYGGVTDHLVKIRRLLKFWESPFSEKWMRATSIQRGTDE